MSRISDLSPAYVPVSRSCLSAIVNRAIASGIGKKDRPTVDAASVQDFLTDMDTMRARRMVKRARVAMKLNDFSKATRLIHTACAVVARLGLTNLANQLEPLADQVRAARHNLLLERSATNRFALLDDMAGGIDGNRHAVAGCAQDFAECFENAEAA